MGCSENPSLVDERTAAKMLTTLSSTQKFQRHHPSTQIIRIILHDSIFEVLCYLGPQRKWNSPREFSFHGVNAVDDSPVPEFRHTAVNVGH